MPGTPVTLTKGGTAWSFALRAGGFLGQRKSLSRASSGLAGHPFVLCPGDRKGSASGPGVAGSRGYRECSWQTGQTHKGWPGLDWPSTSIAGPWSSGKSCASPSHDSWGQGQGGGSQWSELLWGGECHTAKASCRTGQGVATMTPLLSGVFKDQGQ